MPSTTAVPKVTVDANVVLDCLEKRPRHRAACALFALHSRGELDIAVAPQGYRADVPNDPLKSRIQQFLDRLAIRELPQLAYPSEFTFPSDTLYPGAYIVGLVDAWNAVLASWKSHEGPPPGDKDRWHVESHLVARRDVLLTNDGPLLVMCQRLQTEHSVAIRAVPPADYIADFVGPGVSDPVG